MYVGSITGAAWPAADLAGGATPVATSTAAATARNAEALSHVRRLNLRSTCMNWNLLSKDRDMGRVGSRTGARGPTCLRTGVGGRAASLASHAPVARPRGGRRFTTRRPYPPLHRAHS